MKFRICSSSLLLISAIFYSCNSEMQEQHLSTEAKVTDTNSVFQEKEVRRLKEQPSESVIGLELFDVDTVSQQEFNRAEGLYKNPYIQDTSFIKKRNGIISVPILNETLIFTDHQNPEDETDVVTYDVQGNLGPEFYFITLSYYEDGEGLLIQPASGNIDTIYDEPIVSMDHSRLISPITKYGALGCSGFQYFSKVDETFKKHATLELNNGLLFDKFIWQGSSVFLKAYDTEDHNNKESSALYLRFTLK